MATSWEQKQAEAQKQAQKNKLIASAGVTIVQGVQQQMLGGRLPGQILGDVINFVTEVSIGAWQFFSTKKTQKKRERLKKKQQAVQNTADTIITEIEETGLAIVQQLNLDPTSPEFEKALYDELIQKVGYKGNCNAVVWMPGSTPGPDRKVWFKVTDNGRKLTPVNLIDAPANFQEFWYVKCKNAKDTWINAYRKVLVAQGRTQELQIFDKTVSKSTLIVRIVFGLLFAILGIIVVRNMTRIK